MPTYSFINTETQEEFSDFMTMTEMVTYLRDNPHISQTINTPPLISYSHTGKPEAGFRDLLKEIKRNNRGSKINTY